MKNYDLEILVPEWGAGTTQGWDIEKYGMRGVGIATFRFNDKEVLRVKIKNTVYGISKRTVLDFIREYPKSMHMAHGVMLYVVPIAIMRVLDEVKVEHKKVEEPFTLKQISLF